MKRRWWLLPCVLAMLVAINVLPQVYDFRQVGCFLRSPEEKKSELLHVWLGAGDAAMEVGRWKRGQPLNKPETADPKAELVRALEFACDLSEADRQLLAKAERTVATDGKFAHPHFRIVLPGTYERYAVTFFERAVSLDPGNTAASRSLAEARLVLPQAIRGQVRGWPPIRLPAERTKTVEEVMAAFKAFEKDPERKQAMSRWLLQDAAAAAKQHDYRRAAEQLGLVLQFDSANSEADQALSALPSLALEAARHYAQAGRFDEAEDLLEEALHFQPENPEVSEVRQWMNRQRALAEQVRREAEASPQRAD